MDNYRDTQNLKTLKSTPTIKTYSYQYKLTIYARDDEIKRRYDSINLKIISARNKRGI